MDDFDALRATAVTLLTGAGPAGWDHPAWTAATGRLSEAAAGHLAAMDPVTLWPDLPLAAGAGAVWESYRRLRLAATAWATPGAAQHDDDRVLGRLVSALDLLNRDHYHERLPETGNWWFWEIGSPAELTRVCVLLGDRLSPDRRAAYLRAVDRFCPDPDRRTGHPDVSESAANRADKAFIVALRGVAGRGAAELALARDALSDTRDGGRHSLFRYAATGDGFHRDGSFIQHGHVAYTGSYGVVQLAAVTQVLALLAGSPWRVSDPAAGVVLDWVVRSFAPFVHDGLMMDAVRGRAVTRRSSADHVIGHEVITAVLLLARDAPEPHRSGLRALAKGWMLRDERHPYLERAPAAAVRAAVEVAADPEIPAAPGPTGHFVFPAMDRVVHRRPGWSFAISMSSARTSAYEAINGENLRGWYTGDGMTYLYPGGPAGYGDDFWPTVNPYRLPGTTVCTGPREDLSFSAYRPVNAWAGGAVLGGRYGAAAMELIGHDVTLRARKSWFCLDTAVMALGSGITSSDGRTIETVVENRISAADPYLGDGWAHLEGAGGYVFTGARTMVETRTGCWRDVNAGFDTGGTTDPITRRYVTFWFDHGVNPVDAGYAYVLLPNATRAETAAFALTAPVRVLANTAEVQAVEHEGLVAATFWSAGTAGPVSADAPCAALVRRSPGRLSVAVADPSRTVDTVTLTLGHPVRAVAGADDTVTVKTGTNPTVTVRLAGSLGRTHTAELDLEPELEGQA
ncbi:polysaccharide lyase 8 family protein [Nonomuraea sp. NN258]|uniref:polysaccharide lyase 8 family protein n=1 Tax=Nonomuraea antri TaxID=2730852 RepID=UPI001568F3CE|nr:polysaccharide lyase 8 family protein [Nonomuraea antri]NRQ35579.1 polysaccharide lyase 8 family protein [Nonomuraea antri]